MTEPSVPIIFAIPSMKQRVLPEASTTGTPPSTSRRIAPIAGRLIRRARSVSVPSMSVTSGLHAGLRPASSTMKVASPSGRFGLSTSRAIRLPPFDFRR